MHKLIKDTNNLALIAFVFGVNFEYWDPLGLQGVFSIAKMTAIIYILSWMPFVRSISLKHLLYYLMPLFLYMLVEFFSSAYNSIYAESILGTFNFKLLQLLLLLTLIVNHIIKVPKALRWIINSYVVSVVLLAVLSMMGIGVEITDDPTDRLLLFGENPNMIGMKAVFALIVLIYYLLNPNRKWHRLMYVISMIPLLSMLIASGSRGGLLSFFLGVGAIVISQKTSGFRKIVLFISGLLFSTLLFNYIMINNDGFNSRMTYFLEEGETGRNVIWEAALNIIQDNIIIGVGRPGAIPVMMEYLGRPMGTHNVFLHVLVTTGVVGFMFFMIFIVRLSLRLYQKYRVDKNMLFIVLYVILLFNMFKSGGFINKTFLWLLFAILIGSTITQKSSNQLQSRKQ